MSEKKPLTERQAKNCEEAREPVCRCRCGGQLHGKQRGGADASMQFYYSLPEDDPHYTPSPEAKAQRRREKIEAKRRERDEKRAQADKIVDELRTALYTAQRNENDELAAQLQQQFLEAHNQREQVYRETR